MEAWKIYGIGDNGRECTFTGKLWFVEGPGLVNAKYSILGYEVKMTLVYWRKL